MFTSEMQLNLAIKEFCSIENKRISLIRDPLGLKQKLLTKLVETSTLSENPKIKDYAIYMIFEIARLLNAKVASIQNLYTAMGKGKISGFTVPAINIRGFTYDTARAIFRSAKKINAGAFIFEIAKSEMGYTNQRPAEYCSTVLAAAIAEDYRGPIFVQGDHFQVNARKFKEDPQKEIEALKKLIDEAISAGFLNIDIDSSTVVDLSKETLDEQQKLNYEICADMTAYIRENEPAGVTISVGGEIGEVGTKNSTPEEFHAFMKGYLKHLISKGKDYTGISKISVQTGTSHGGVVLPDGSIAKVNLDFSVLNTISKIGREQYGIAGTVQHGASTLPEDAFDKFPENNTAEVHLATGFQNILLDSPNFPKELRDEMYRWLDKNAQDERKPNMTDEQFYYKSRKKVFGAFKKEIWNLPEDTKTKLASELEAKFDLIFKKLNIKDTYDKVNEFVKPLDFFYKPIAVKLEEIDIEGGE
ncbi:MAG: class II fructose-bisphosphate aldolase [Deltaproteobacteria bacterium]|nr:class II fructose-bisphosphate aldolase [Deltaproteobacteria bacterium]